MPADEYVKMASDPFVLGDPLLKTQHFVGASKWSKVSDSEIVAWHQMRVPHQRYTNAEMRDISVKGHAHGSNQHWYRKVDGVWKFAGLAVEIRWGEFDFEKVFADGEEMYRHEQEKTRAEAEVIAGVTAKDSSSFSHMKDGTAVSITSVKGQESPLSPSAVVA